MPNRIVRESIVRSRRVNSLAWSAEVFYRRLLNVVDDYGLYYADSGILRADLYPRKLSQVTESNVTKWKAECAQAGLVSLYQVDGEQYLMVHNVDAPRAKKSRFPIPNDDMRNQMIASASKCLQMSADANKCTVIDIVNEFDIVNTSPAAQGVSFSKAQVEEVYQCYPRKVGKPDALKAIRKALGEIGGRGDDINAVSWLCERVQKFANSPAGQAGKYTPYPATWFNSGRYDDDPQQWESQCARNDNLFLKSDPGSEFEKMADEEGL